MRRIVLDTSVLVAGLRTQLGAGNAILRLVATRRLVALATPPLFLEYEDVLKRPGERFRISVLRPGDLLKKVKP
jgi:predicted nucleic acid-binding protein